MKLNECVLVIDDEPLILTILKDGLGGFNVITCQNADEAMASIKSTQPFLIITDKSMPEKDGIHVTKSMKKIMPSVPIIMMSGHGDKNTAISSFRSGVDDFIEKPFKMDEIVRMVQKYFDQRVAHLEKEAKELKEIRAIFLEEANGIIDSLEENIMHLEQEPTDKALIDSLFRKIHTLKGSSGAISDGQTIKELAHSFENVLLAMKGGKLVLSGDTTDVVLEAADLIKHCIHSLETNSAPPDISKTVRSLDNLKIGATESQATQKQVLSTTEIKDDDSVKVSHAKLEEFMNLAGELVAFKNVFNGITRRTVFQNRILSEQMGDMNKILSKLSDEIQWQVMSLRKVALSKTFAQFPRTVRKIASDQSKDIKLVTEGLHLMVDKSISKALGSAMIHVIRNCCDHGIETPKVRLQKGKPECGTVKILCNQTGDMINIVVEDDGGGIDPEIISQKAIANNLATSAQISKMQRSEIFDFVFMPGFSTAAKVTEVSGRGVGMDVVKTSIQAINGEITLNSEVNKFTRLSLSIPVPKTIIVEASLLAKSQNLFLAIPLADIAEIRPLGDDGLTIIDSHLHCQYQNKTIPIMTLSLLFGSLEFERSQPNFNREDLMVVISHKERTFALMIDSIEEHFEAVIRPFDDVIGKIGGFKGTSILPNEELAYVTFAEEMIDMTFKIIEGPRAMNAA